MEYLSQELKGNEERAGKRRGKKREVRGIGYQWFVCKGHDIGERPYLEANTPPPSRLALTFDPTRIRV